MSNVPTPSPRLQAAAAVLPCIGLFLVMPPVIGLFAVPRDVAGIPLIVLYLFGVWLWLVASAALLSRRIDNPPPDGRPQAGSAPGGAPPPTALPDGAHAEHAGSADSGPGGAPRGAAASDGAG